MDISFFFVCVCEWRYVLRVRTIYCSSLVSLALYWLCLDNLDYLMFCGCNFVFSGQLQAGGGEDEGRVLRSEQRAPLALQDLPHLSRKRKPLTPQQLEERRKKVKKWEWFEGVAWEWP